LDAIYFLRLLNFDAVFNLLVFAGLCEFSPDYNTLAKFGWLVWIYIQLITNVLGYMTSEIHVGTPGLH
jgi:hypothetical protein